MHESDRSSPQGAASEMISIIASPLQQSTFATFGQVIQTAENQAWQINDGTAQRYDSLALPNTAEQGGQTAISLFVGQAFSYPVSITLMERHPLGSQAFMPTSGFPYLVVVALTNQDGTPQAPVAFLAQADQGVNIAKGVWHHPLISLQGLSRFLVVDRVANGENGADNLELHRYPLPAYCVSG